MIPLKEIEIDLQVYKALEGARLSFDETQNDILRRILINKDSHGGETLGSHQPKGNGRTTGDWRVRFRGSEISFPSQKAAFRGVLLMLHEADDQFLGRLLEYRTSHGRRMIAKDKEALGSDAAIQNAEVLVDGYWYDTNLSLPQKKERIESACNFTDVQFGKDLVLEF